MRLTPALTSAAATSVLVAGLLATAPPAPAQGPPESASARPTAKTPTAVGKGGAVSTVDPEASAAALKVLRQGGNAADAAVAAAATLGVTEPYSAGIGGGGYFVFYDAETGKVSTIDGRETAPKKMPSDAFIDPATGKPYNFTPELVTSGVSVGTPGTPATWERALKKYGTLTLADALKPAIKVATRGFKVDETFRQQTLDNEERFRAFRATKKLFLPQGDAPRVGSIFTNPELAATYAELGERGTRAFYRGDLAKLMVDVVRKPRTSKGTDLPVPRGYLSRSDLKDYKVLGQAPTKVSYRGYDVYGMAPSGSGGTTVGEALNILERGDLAAADKTGYLHRYLEASKLGFADRNRWVGDPAFSDVPTGDLLSDEFAASRECLISDDAVLPAPAAPGDPASPQGCDGGRGGGEPYEGPNTTHLTVADASGDIVSYTLTIEQTGGSGIVVPGRGFLLNNELTELSFTPATPGVPDPNLPGPGKRPRSSMSPTIVLQDGKPVLALGSPGGSTIITTVLQTLPGRLDRGQRLVDAIAEPRASQRNSATTDAEPGFLSQPEAAKLEALGHRFKTSEEIGAATGVELLPDGRWIAAAEPHRRGGGAAGVVIPTP